MRQTESDPHRDTAGARRSPLRGALILCILLALAILSAGCSQAARPDSTSPAAREASLREIAAEFARSGDLAQAQARLAELNLPNPGQLLVMLAETDLSAGRPADDVEPLAELAQALGSNSPRLMAYFAPTALPTSTATAVPPTATPAPATATPEPPTAAPPTATPAPAATAEPTVAPPTETPVSPRVIANTNANVRSGPGRNYPVIGSLRTGQEVEVSARNANGDWWRIAWNGQSQAWVSGTTVRLQGQIDTVAVADNIPPPPPTSTPRPTSPPAEQPPAEQPANPPPAVSGPDFRVSEKRLWNVEENGGSHDGPSVHCGDKRELHVIVLDAAGNPLNGVTVKANLGAMEEIVTGHKGAAGSAEFVLGGGQEITIIRDVDGRPVTSDYVAGLTTRSPDIPKDVLMAAGYCTEDNTCDAFLKRMGCNGHHSWTVTFRRAY